MNFTEIFLVIASIIIFIIYLLRRSSIKTQKVNEHQKVLFLEMLRKKFPDFPDVINTESVTLFLYEWQKRIDDSKVQSYTRMFSGVKRGEIVFLGGFISSLEESYASRYVLSECGKHISEEFAHQFLEGNCVNDFYAIKDMISTSMNVAQNL